MAITSEKFGTTRDGRQITLFTITNSNGSILKVTDMGAIWVSMVVRDRNGKMDDVILGLGSGEDYEKGNPAALGAVVGRNANRICNACFTLNGVEYKLAKNDGENNLHSGPDSYYQRLWDAELISDEEGQGVEFTLESPDGDQGMPGNLTVSVSYVLTEDDSVVIEYNGISDADTVVNMTNHAYFNLGGHSSGCIEDEKVWIDADSFTFGTDSVVTTGEVRSVEGTPFDFRQLKKIGDDINAQYEPLNRCGGYDHNFCLNTNGEDVSLVAKVVDEKTGRVMDIFTDMPGMQMYTGNFLYDPRGKDGAEYKARDGVAFETQFYPDAVNQPQFPSPVVKAGEEFNYCTVYHFDTLEE